MDQFTEQIPGQIRTSVLGLSWKKFEKSFIQEPEEIENSENIAPNGVLTRTMSKLTLPCKRSFALRFGENYEHLEYNSNGNSEKMMKRCKSLRDAFGSVKQVNIPKNIVFEICMQH